MSIFENVKPEDIKILDSPPGSTPEPAAKEEATEEAEGAEEGEKNAEGTSGEGQEGQQEEGEEFEQQEGEDPEFEITEDIANDIVAQRFGISAEEIEGKLQRLEELENGEMTFKSAKHQKAYEFLANYSGDDYEGGIVRYARIQGADVKTMTPEQAMKELYIQKNADLTIEEASAVWESEHNAKYSDLDDTVTKIKFDQEGRQAKNELAQLKETFEAKEETPDYESEAAEIAQVRQEFLGSVDSSLQDYSAVEMELDGEPESAFTFEIGDTQRLKESMSDVNTFYANQGWITPDGKMNAEKMKIDMSFLQNKEAILEQYYKHGKNVAKEQVLAEINNSTKKGSKREAPPVERSGPMSLNERLAQARPLGQ